MDPLTLAAVGWSVKAVGWVISPIISKLIRRCCTHLGFDASKKLEELGPKVLQLERVMEVVEGSPYKDRLEVLCKDLKSALYEAEDILDDIEYHRLERMVRDDKLKSHESTSGSKKNSLMKKVRYYQQKRKEAHKDHQESGMSKSQLKNSFEKIERVVNDACKILEQLNLTGIANCDGGRVSAANSKTAVTTADPPLKVIGRDEERDKIIAMLHEEDCNGQQNSNNDVCYSVIGIHGVAGSGKSTLAQYICAREKKDKEENKDGHFDLVIWIHVSQKFDLDAIFRDMLEGATGKACPQFSSRSTLVENLKKELREKRILLVLDDVWYNIRSEGRHQLERELEELLSPMMVAMTGSRILVTSRTKDALLALGAVEERCVPISELPDEVFLQMFVHYAFRGVTVAGHDRTKLELIGAEITKKLNRSPLAARTVGSLLCKRPDVVFWRMTRDQDLLKETKGALWWSYRHLDEQVRRCFAYCSIFPRRYGLRRDELVRLWVAEGFIKATNAEAELDAIGESYIDELLSASFLQLGGKRKVFGGEVEYFTVHDLLRDLAEEVAGSDCFRIEKGWIGEVPQDVRHLFVGTYNREILMEKILKLQNLRTLVINYVPRGQMIKEEVFEVMFKKLLKLRVISVDHLTNDFKFSVPESIVKLKHLRYLALKVAGRTKMVLPHSLTNLYHIQLLDFGDSLNLAFSSGEKMNQLINLRRVTTRADLEFPNIGKLAWLQELRFFTVKNKRGYELQQLKNLNKLQGKLQIHGLENVGSKDDAVEASLADKEQLAELVLCWDADGSCSPDVQAEVLEALCPSKYLEALEIRHYSGLTYPNWMVGKQEGGPKHLQKLKLWNIPLVAPPELYEVFVHLRSLKFWDCDWDILSDNMERLTNLKKLRLVRLKNIRALPMLPLSLEKIEIENCNRSFMESCKRIGDPNWEKVQHITKKYIF